MGLLLIFSLVALALISWDYDRVVKGFVALEWQQAGKTRGVGSTVKPEITLFPQYYDYFQVAKISIKPGMQPADIQFIERNSLRFAFTPILSRLALAYAENNRPSEALLVLEVIQKLNGHNYPETYRDWEGFSHNNKGDFTEIFGRMPKPDVPMSSGKN